MAGIVVIVAFAAAGVWVAMGIDGYRITMIPDMNGQPNPLAKTVAKMPGAWLDNYGRFNWTLAAPFAASRCVQRHRLRRSATIDRPPACSAVVWRDRHASGLSSVSLRHAVIVSSGPAA